MPGPWKQGRGPIGIRLEKGPIESGMSPELPDFAVTVTAFFCPLNYAG